MKIGDDESFEESTYSWIGDEEDEENNKEVEMEGKKEHQSEEKKVGMKENRDRKKESTRKN